MVKEYTVISLFAGGGGSSLGYKMAGFKELLAVEYDNNAIETLKANYDFDIWQKDITEIKDGEILERYNIKRGELDILDGSPPCQGFSTAGKRQVSDLRNDLYKSYVKILNDLQPKVFVMENVSGMMKGKMKGRFNEILKGLKSLNYNVKCKLMNAKYYNVPQSRERLIFIGIRKDFNIEPNFPKANNKNIENKEYNKDIKGYFQEKIYPQIKQGKSGINGKYYNTRRLDWNKPSPTICKSVSWAGFSQTIHPDKNRDITIDEMKRLCSFPDNYILIGNYSEKVNRLGNAVMPNMMKAIAENIRINILDKYYQNNKEKIRNE